MSVVIVNPSSAGGSTGEAWPQIASDLRSQFGAFKAVFTKKRGDAAALAGEAARKGAKFIIACGGDGTVSEVANGILSAGKDVELGILPSGTGGDFRRTLEIPSQSRAAARVLRTGRTVRIDVGRVSFVDHNGAEAMRYYERIIRNERELDAICAYIHANPARWADDPERVPNTR